MPAEMKQQIEAIKSQTHKASLPEIPRWLTAAPPLWAMFMPNGEVVTYGPLGSWQEDWQKLPKEQQPKGGGYYRYSASGELLGTSLGDQANWAHLYNPQYASLELSGKSQGYVTEISGGFLIWRQPKELGGEAVAAWDYDGSPLALDKPLTRERGFLRLWQWEQLKGKAEDALAQAN